MPVEMATLGAVGGLILPVYAALWSLNAKVGEIAARTEHNEQAVEHISTAVDTLSERATYVDARYRDDDEAGGSFSDARA